MSSKPIIVWGDPPVKARAPRQLRFTAHVESLKERPGQWACIRRHPNHKTLNSMRNTIRNGKAYQRLIEPGRVELVVRRTRDGEDFGIWARWIPPKDGGT